MILYWEKNRCIGDMHTKQEMLPNILKIRKNGGTPF